MTDATDLWIETKRCYNETDLTSLTNIRNQGASGIDDAVGERACTDVLALWPAYAQVAYDGTDSLHVMVAKEAVIALLWHRGGTAAGVSGAKWDDIWADGGLISKVRETGPRGRPSAATNSGLTQSSELQASGQRSKPWSDPAALPQGRAYLPSSQAAD